MNTFTSPFNPTFGTPFTPFGGFGINPGFTGQNWGGPNFGGWNNWTPMNTTTPSFGGAPNTPWNGVPNWNGFGGFGAGVPFGFGGATTPFGSVVGTTGLTNGFSPFGAFGAWNTPFAGTNGFTTPWNGFGGFNGFNGGAPFGWTGATNTPWNGFGGFGGGIPFGFGGWNTPFFGFPTPNTNPNAENNGKPVNAPFGFNPGFPFSFNPYTGQPVNGEAVGKAA